MQMNKLSFREISGSPVQKEGLVEFSICSDTPVRRYDEFGREYDEILLINEESVDLSRLQSGSAPFLWGHNQDDVLGVIEKAWIDGNKVRILVRFSKREEAQRRREDVLDGISTCCSIGYEIQHCKQADQIQHCKQGEGNTIIVDKFMIYEASLVSVPADDSVGYQRNFSPVNSDTKVNNDNSKLLHNIDKQSMEKAISEEKIEEKNESPEEDKQVVDPTVEEIVPVAVEGGLTNDDNNGAIADESGDESIAGTDNEHREGVVEENLTGVSENEIIGNPVIEESKETEESQEMSEEEESVEEESESKVEEDKQINERSKNTMKFSIRKAILNATTRGKFDPESVETQSMNELRAKYGLNEADVILENTRAIDGSEALNQTIYRPDLYAGALRPQSVIARVGATYVPVEGPSISFAVAEKGCAGGFVDVNGEIPNADMTFVQKTLTPKKFGAYCELSYKALLQDRPEIEQVITEDILKAVDEIRDKALVAGTGTGNEPTGILNTDGINTVTLPDTFSLATAYEFEKPIRDANIFTDNLKWVMSSKMFYKLATTPKSSTALNEFLIDENRKMIGYDVIVDNHLGDNGILLGDFSEAIVADFEPISLKVVEDAGLSRKQAVEVQSFGAVDVCVRRPKAFTKGV